MENYQVCCAFGHRDVITDITTALDAAVFTAVQKGCRVFMTGGNGDFDRQFALAVRRAKQHFPHIRLELIKPYFSNAWNTHKDDYSKLYDAIVVPDELSNVHYKSAITACNRFMVTIIAYVHRDFGGAYTAVRYAQTMQKQIIL